MMSTKGEESLEELVDVYQKLVEIEYRKLESFKFNFKRPETFLTKKDVLAIGMSAYLDSLINKGLLIPFREGVYRTAHFDLIHRLIYIRNLKNQIPIPLEHKVVLKSELVPDFGRYDVEKTLEGVLKSPHKNLVIKCLAPSLKQAGYKGFSSYQYPLIREMLSGSSRYIAIVAPTASGKTLTFLVPLLVRSIERVVLNKHGTVSLLIYPRKALERDQLRTLLKLIDVINEELKKEGRDTITIGIDDGDTPREAEECNDNESFRGLKCIKCDGELVIKLREGKALVTCRDCGKEYVYVLPTKDAIWAKKPTILITNIWTVYRRLLSPRTIDIFKTLDFIVIDEAHVYTHFLGGHVNYILRMLEYVASLKGGRPTFVFSSATIPNPKEFIASLAGINEHELFYIDFQEVLEKAPGTKRRRIILYLYLLPHPYRDIETLAQACILAITLWCHKHGMKGLTFVDSISEISTITDYIHATILGEREGREVTDHIFKTEQDPMDDYCWISLTPRSLLKSDLLTFKKFVLGRYKQSIGAHHGNLTLNERVKIESEFVKGEKRMLLSTSTLELGIDLSDVAVILQYKLPMTPEGVVQRIGRAGRNSRCYRIALGIILLPTSPLGTLYIFNDQLRNSLENVGSLPPLQIGKASYNIRLQHVFSLLLLKRALDGRKTFIESDELRELSKRGSLIACLEEMKRDLNSLVNFNREVQLFEEEELKRLVNKLAKLMDSLLDGLKRVEEAAGYEGIERASDIEEEVKNCLKQIKKMKEEIHYLRSFLSSNNVPLKIKEQIDQYSKSIRLTFSKLLKLRESIRLAIKEKNQYHISRWLEENHDFDEIVSKLPSSNELPNLYRKLYEVIPSDYLLEIMGVLYNLGKTSGSEKEGLIKFLRSELLSVLKSLTKVDFRALSAREALERVKAQLDSSFKPGSAPDVLKLLSLLLEEVQMSLLLEAPSPDFELEMMRMEKV